MYFSLVLSKKKGKTKVLRRIKANEANNEKKGIWVVFIHSEWCDEKCL